MYESGELQEALGVEDEANGASGQTAPEPAAQEPAPLTIENRL